MSNDYVCKYCGGRFNHRVNLWTHIRMEEERFVNGKQGDAFLVCRECGMRAESLSVHLCQHGITSEQYLAKYPGEVLTLPSLVQRRSEASRGTHMIPIQQRAGATFCDKCDEWYLQRFAADHLADCVSAHPDKYIEGEEYVKCPECKKALSRLGPHLKEEHGWDEDRIVLETSRGLQIMAGHIKNKWKAHQDFKAAQEKREQTHLKRHGHKNPFSDPMIQEKITETNQKRYGVDHPMKNEEVFTRQQESAQDGPSGQEIFFMEHVICPNVIYTGYGGRFIRTQTGVRKYGRTIKDLNPDFMVLPDNVLESAIDASKERSKMSSEKHRTKYVIELLGDYYHSEQVIGIPAAEHEREIIAAYKSAGIECLTLWEHDVLGRWNEIEPMVNAWIQKAVSDINANPVWRKQTKSKVDGRLATFMCPHGSGRKFKTQEQLDAWMNDQLNFWRPGMIEGKDYVRCLECAGDVRIGKLMEHLRQVHPEMTREEYLGKHPGVSIVAERVVELVRANSGSRVGKKYTARVAYRCPDGSIVRKRDAWIRSWGEQTPPADSIVSADSVNLDPWQGKAEGEDYVVCQHPGCGYRASNLTRHLKDRHGGIEGYAGQIHSKKCDESLKEGAKKVWDARGRSEPKDVSQNKTHKTHGLITKEVLEQMYVVDGLSDAKIGEKFGVTGEAISYQRKKHGMATRQRASELVA